MHRDELTLSFRCSERWEAMEGDAKTRHCRRCDRSVVDLSARSELAARLRLAIHRGEHPPCVRYAVAPDGQVRFRPGLLARAAAALVALVPLGLASRAQAHDADPQPGQAHLCSSAPDREIIVLGVRRSPPRLRGLWRRAWALEQLRPHGNAAAHIAADEERFVRVAVRCEGSELPRRKPLLNGEAVVGGLPGGKTCRARLTGPGRPLVIEFTAGDAATEVELP